MSTFAITGPITLDARLVHGTVTVHMRDFSVPPRR